MGKPPAGSRHPTCRGGPRMAGRSSRRDLAGLLRGREGLTPEEHVWVQAVVQSWTDSSLSKTCNGPSSYTVDDTRTLYELAYDLGCKGVTIYRDHRRAEHVLTRAGINPKNYGPGPGTVRSRCGSVPTAIGSRRTHISQGDTGRDGPGVYQRGRRSAF